MMSTTKEAELGTKLHRMPGVHRVRRPVTPDAHRQFDLAYIRTGPPSDSPLLIIPGGPGLASVLPYKNLRKDATSHGLDVIMVEHRGIGLSRHEDNGVDLPAESFTVHQVLDDIAAVLDDCGISQTIVYGSSYGGYLAQAFGARHPKRVAGMVLDSTVLTAHYEHVVRDNTRDLLWRGESPHTAAVAAKFRSLVDDGIVSTRETGGVVPVVYEFGGVPLLNRFYDELAAGRGQRTWRWVLGLTQNEVGKRHPFVMECDLVNVLLFREVELPPEPDGLPLDPGLVFTEQAPNYPPFEGEPYELPEELPKFDWPCAVISGERDLRTPRVIAEQIADLIPDGVLVPLEGMGHSALDTHRLAALHVAHSVAEGTHRELPRLLPRITALPRRGASGALGKLITARLTAERALRV